VVYSCLVCQDPRERLAYNCKSHEQSIAHQNHLKSFHPTTPNVLGTSQSPHPSSSVPTAVTPDEVIKEDVIRALIRSLSAQPGQPWYPTTHPQASGSTAASTSTSRLSPVTGIDWNVFEALEDTTLEYDPLQQAAERIAQASLDFLNGDLSADDEDTFLDCESDHSEELGSFYN